MRSLRHILACGAGVIALVFFSGALTNCETRKKSAQSDTETFEETLAKAEKGDADAQVDLGIAYYIGEGVVKNEAISVKWYRKAAEQGDATGQFFLGSSYQLGRGVVANKLIAYQWYLLASAQGDETARENLLILEQELTAEQRTEVQRAATEWQAAFEKRQAEK